MAKLGAPEGEAERTMQAADTMKNGVITFDEFCAAVGPVYEHSHVALRRAFHVFDADRNGFIDRNERAHHTTACVGHAITLPAVRGAICTVAAHL